ncbi:hypothetical protein WISP_95637 [Willisornis vidua]|uniref:Uncharacterized protein n=1 Tax=Willisornis vidua TaxID=1566151 RepID=A0ABQ9D065_9PASS|nr:hypothetical protein WISP_95637 [Willisornis vidua]
MEMLESPSLEVFKKRLDMALSAMVWLLWCLVKSWTRTTKALQWGFSPGQAANIIQHYTAEQENGDLSEMLLRHKQCFAGRGGTGVSAHQVLTIHDEEQHDENFFQMKLDTPPQLLTMGKVIEQYHHIV